VGGEGMKVVYRTDTVEIKKLMIERGIKTILQLSAQTGINRNTLSQILNGEIQPSADAMRKLVSVLVIPPEKAGLIFFNPNLRIA
jgi:transcriptional regulator with XRE-family HTH domain